MNRGTITKIWTAVSLLSMYLGINGLLIAQGSPWTLPVPIEIAADSFRPKVTGVYFSYAASVVVYITSLLLALAYSKRFGGVKGGLDRFPVFLNLPLLHSDPLSKWYQRFWLAVYLVLIPYTIGHCLRETLESTVARCEGSETLISGGIPFGHSNAAWFDVYKLGNCAGVDYFGRSWDFVQIGFAVLALVLMLTLTYRLMRKRDVLPASAKPDGDLE